MKNKPKPTLLIISAFFLILILLAATIIGIQAQTRRIMKEDLLGEHPTCNLPCWKQIMPAKTTKDEAIKILKDISYIDQGSIQQSGTNELGGCIWNWKISGRRIIPSLSWQNGIIQEISLSVAYDLSVSDVIREFGPPEAVDFTEGGIPENWYWVVNMYYPESGFQVKAYTTEFSSLLEPSTEVGGIILFSPTSIENRVFHLFPDTHPEEINLLYEPWKGYGDLKELYEVDKK